MLDANGTDGSASFQLPNPDPDKTVDQYSVFARALGKPGGSSRTTTCATDPRARPGAASIDGLGRKSRAVELHQRLEQLLYIYADIDGDGTIERYTCSATAAGLLLAVRQHRFEALQLRFYEVPTTVP